MVIYFDSTSAERQTQSTSYENLFLVQNSEDGGSKRSSGKLRAEDLAGIVPLSVSFDNSTQCISASMFSTSSVFSEQSLGEHVARFASHQRRASLRSSSRVTSYSRSISPRSRSFVVSRKKFRPLRSDIISDNNFTYKQPKRRFGLAIMQKPDQSSSESAHQFEGVEMKEMWKLEQKKRLPEGSRESVVRRDAEAFWMNSREEGEYNISDSDSEDGYATSFSIGGDAFSDDTSYGDYGSDDSEMDLPIPGKYKPSLSQPPGYESNILVPISRQQIEQITHQYESGPRNIHIFVLPPPAPIEYQEQEGCQSCRCVIS